METNCSQYVVLCLVLSISWLLCRPFGYLNEFSINICGNELSAEKKEMMEGGIIGSQIIHNYEIPGDGDRRIK